jgi:uncharacterized protein YciI
MLFAVIGFLKPGVGALSDLDKRKVNEQLSQPLLQLKLGGKLTNRAGDLIGTMVCMDVESFDLAEEWAKGSPYFLTGQYERIEVAALNLEVGTL